MTATMSAVLGWVGSALVVMSLTQRNVRRLRQLNLAASIVLGIFNLALGIASMIALNAVLAAVNSYHLLGSAARPGTSATRPAIEEFTSRAAARAGANPATLTTM